MHEVITALPAAAAILGWIMNSSIKITVKVERRK